MTSKVVVLLQDDLDGSEATETIQFMIDGVEYEIDLSERNANRLRNSLKEFTSRGRKVGGRRRARATAKASRFDQIDSHAVRVWAEANGIEISSRGRIPADIISQYQAAGN